jgi:23S rRNA (uracil1939-C5)-methyltransferase
MKNLAASGVARIIYVSCNPEALSQDAALLRRAGYACLSARPIDQFPYSENLEAVAVFNKV